MASAPAYQPRTTILPLFIRRLNNWADYRLKGGRNALPLGLFSYK